MPGRVDYTRWPNRSSAFPSIDFTCGYCDNVGASVFGYICEGTNSAIVICTRCGVPSFKDGPTGRVYPRPKAGRKIGGLPLVMGELYEEARSCFQAGAFTAVVLVGRVLLT